MTFIPAYSAVRDDVEDAILSNPSNTNLPTFVSRDEAVSELPVGALFRSAEGANSERLYLRVSEAPGYQDQGDNYALLTAAQFGNVDNTADADKPVSGPQAAALAEKVDDALVQYTTFEEHGAVGDGVADDTDAIVAARDTGKAIRGSARKYRISLSIDLSGRDLDLSDCTFMADEPVVVSVGGNFDTTTTIVPAVTEIASGAREFPYTSITGTLAANDWILVKGHLEGALTTASGRIVQQGYPVMVRAVDTVNKIIKLQHAIPWKIDSETTEDGFTSTLTVEKFLPQRVRMANTLTSNVTIAARCHVDSVFDVTLLDTVSAGFSFSSTSGHNPEHRIRTRARSTLSSNHCVVLTDIFGGTTEINGSGTNYSTITDTSQIAKALRYNGLAHHRLTTNFASTGLAEVVGMCAVNSHITLISSDNGTYNTDRGITTGNRNDANQLNWCRGCAVELNSIEADATPFEFCNAWDTSLVVNARKVRPGAPNADAGFVNVKMGSKRVTVTGRVFLRNDPNNQAVRVECGDRNLDGTYSEDVTVRADIDCDGTGVIFRNNRTVPGAAITQAGGVATLVSPSPHRLKTGDIIIVSGASEAAYNVRQEVTVVDANTAIFAVDSGAPASATGAIDVRVAQNGRHQVIGSTIHARLPVVVNDGIENGVVLANKVTVNTTLSSPSHAIAVAAQGWEVQGNITRGTSGATRRAVTMGRSGKVRYNTSDGGFFHYYEPTLAGFNLTDWQGNNQPVTFANKTFQMRHRPSGWATDAAIVYDNTALEYILRQTGGTAAANLDFNIGQIVNDELRMIDPNKRLTVRWDGTYWIATQRQQKRFWRSGYAVGTVAPGASGYIEVTATGTTSADICIGWREATGIADGSGLTWGHPYCVADGVRIPYRNTTAEPITLGGASYYVVVMGLG